MHRNHNTNLRLHHTTSSGREGVGVEIQNRKPTLRGGVAPGAVVYQRGRWSASAIPCVVRQLGECQIRSNLSKQIKKYNQH